MNPAIKAVYLAVLVGLNLATCIADQVSTALDGRQLDTNPRIVKKHALEYPEFLLQLGEIHGTVLLEFIVDEKGEVRVPRILQASHPAFVPPSIDALRKSKFAPGTIGGTPVKCAVSWAFSFEVIDRYNKGIGREAFSIAEHSPPGIPAEFQYDDAPRIVTLCEPAYPFELAVANMVGEAEVRFVVSADGTVAAAKVMSASRPEFGAALAAAIEAWRFTAPTFEGKRTMALLSRKQQFSPGNRDLSSDVQGKRVMKLLRAGKNEFAGLVDLDETPRVIYQVPACYPKLLEEQAVAGVAQLEFIIDQGGRVRAPRIVSASREEFGWAAATAVQQWFYEPPRRRGKPVDVRLSMPFEFNPRLQVRQP
ncbi:MAG: transport protein TonB [Verrucomicrobia bacterium]|nr:transport protein TonB [Verrucomicrobiota bacterium]